MNRIVREHYPVAALPEDLREGFEPDAEVRVVVEPAVVARPDKVMTLEELFALADSYRANRSMDEIVAEIRRQRDEWDD